MNDIHHRADRISFPFAMIENFIFSFRERACWNVKKKFLADLCSDL